MTKLDIDRLLIEDRGKYIEAVDNELLDLHGGNISCYRNKLTEFKKWKIIGILFDHKLQ